ncbi:diaminopimelate decarboxylase [Paenibacillaceae bacterium GAS479]|nr:diaminopimelate decarboxylase [Paenibacillaceae bacterium GAS479]
MNRQVERWIHEWQAASDEPVCAYVYDLAGIRRHAASLLPGLPRQGKLFYAIKANPDKRIIEALLPVVAGFEVASIGELRRVREVSAQVPILFGGPGKKDTELEAAVELGVAYIHVESLLELRKLIAITARLEQPVKVLLRVNLSSGQLPQTKIVMGGRPTPFGLDESYLEEAMEILGASGNEYVRCHGFHFHSLSNNVNAELHADMVDLYLAKAEEWRARGLDVRVINAGGGFGVTYDGSPGFDWARFSALMKERGVEARLGDTELFFEPGRFIVADYGYYAVEVVDIKQSHGQHFAVVRGGTHHNRLPASWGHDHPFHIVDSDRWPYPFARPSVTDGLVTIAGELCTPKDRLHTDAPVERLQAGDVVVFVKSGAYCWTISHHDFLGHPHPEFHYITEGNDYADIDDSCGGQQSAAADHEGSDGRAAVRAVFSAR